MVDPQTKTFTKKTELVFTTIEIERKYIVLVGEEFTATFNCGKTESDLKLKMFKSKSLIELLKDISIYLDCEIDERHYIIK